MRFTHPLVALAGGLGCAAARAAPLDRSGGRIDDTPPHIMSLAHLNGASRSGHTVAGAYASGTKTRTAVTDRANSPVDGGTDDRLHSLLNPLVSACSHDFDPDGGFPLGVTRKTMLPGAALRTHAANPSTVRWIRGGEVLFLLAAAARAAQMPASHELQHESA